MTGVPRELNDDEVLQHGIGRGEHDDPYGDHALSRYRTNQALSILVRGAMQLGYRRQHFLVNNHIREGTEVDTSMVHSSCAALLAKLVGKITGYQQFSMLTPRSRHAPSYIFNIDPFGICQLWGAKDCTRQLITMMVDLQIPIQHKYTTRLTNARAKGPENVYQGNALQHLPGGSMLPPGRTSILNTPLTAEEEAEIAPKAKPKAANRASDPQERKRRNQETYQQRYSESWEKSVAVSDHEGGHDHIGHHDPQLLGPSTTEALRFRMLVLQMFHQASTPLELSPRAARTDRWWKQISSLRLCCADCRRHFITEQPA